MGMPRMRALKATSILTAIVILVGAGLLVSGLGQALMFKAYGFYAAPSPAFTGQGVVAAPDYGHREFWAALPGMEDPADLVPDGIAPLLQGRAEVDTFFIHPTGFLKSSSWTSPLDKHSATEENTVWMMANQASAFNGCCDVYAPRYREATIFAYMQSADKRDAVLDFAYEDVKRAFIFYLEHDNHGRPFIIASHSQGTHLAQRLLSDVIDQSDLYQRMVAAYMIGAYVIPISPAWLSSLKQIKPCQSATDLHCVIHWDTAAQGTDPIERPAASLCTNPLTWQVSETAAGPELNEGAVVPAGKYNLDFGKTEDLATGQQLVELSAPQVARTGAQCRDGTLFVANQSGSAFLAMRSDNNGNYHGLDYALFYMNIRNNAILRAQTFIDNQG